MKSYTLAALVSSTLGWSIATAFYSVGYFLLERNQAWEAIKIIAPITLIISLLANVFFLQLPRYFIKKLFPQSNHLAFGIAYSILAYLTLKLTFGSPFGYNPIEQLGTSNPIINGFVLGYTFHSIWKPEYPVPKNPSWLARKAE